MIYRIKESNLLSVLPLLLLVLININSGFSQSFNSSGSIDSLNNIHISWSIGETFISQSDKTSVGSLASSTLKVEEITTNNASEELNIVLYPNPSNDNVYLEMDQDIHHFSISLINTAGVFLPIKIEYSRNGKITIPIRNLQNGIYYLNINENKTQSHKTFKIIKK